MDVDNEKIVAAVQKVQAIYDKTHKLYSNRQFLNKAWKDIGQELNIDGNVAKKKWTSLRDYFQRQHREMTTFTSGSAPSKKKKWSLYDTMSFLVPYVTDRPASTNVSDMNEIEAISFETSSHCSTEVPVMYSHIPEEETVNISVVETPSSPEMECSEAISKRYPSHRSGRKRSARSDIDWEILNTLRKIPTTREPPPEEDADLLFFKSMIPQVKTLDLLQKMELQAEMHNVLFKHLKRARANTESSTHQRNYSTATEQEN